MFKLEFAGKLRTKESDVPTHCKYRIYKKSPTGFYPAEPIQEPYGTVGAGTVVSPPTQIPAIKEYPLTGNTKDEPYLKGTFVKIEVLANFKIGGIDNWEVVGVKDDFEVK